MLFVRRVGYRFAAAAVELRNRDTARVSLELPALTLLDTIRVTASPWVRSELDELGGRLRGASVGRVLTSEALRSFGTVVTAFQSFPTLWVQRRPGGVSAYMVAGTRLCRPTVWLDGLRSDLRMAEAQSPEDLIALEVYPRFEVPTRYQDFSNCSVVLAWTRVRR